MCAWSSTCSSSASPALPLRLCSQALAALRACPALPTDAGIYLAAYGWPSLYGLLAAAMDGTLEGCNFDGLPASWDVAFDAPPVADDVMCEALILPELAGSVDIPDLLQLCPVMERGEPTA